MPPEPQDVLPVWSCRTHPFAKQQPELSACSPPESDEPALLGRPRPIAAPWLPSRPTAKTNARRAAAEVNIWLISTICSGIWEGEAARSEEHTSELQSLMRISYAVFCLKKKRKQKYRLKDSDHRTMQ